MTARKFTAINGCVARMVAPGEWEAVDEHGAVRASCKGVREEKRALWLMSEEIYRANRFEAMKRDGWKCVQCGSPNNLTAHHKVHRGIAGTNRKDDTGALVALCMACHQKVHGG